jgi:AAA family ATP:ADP antiporter
MLERIRKQFFDIRPGEWPKALSLSLYFFLVIAVFWVLKPMKRGIIINYFGNDPIAFLGLTFGGAQAEQIGKMLNMVVAFGVVALFTWLIRKMDRHRVILIFCTVFGGLFLFFGSFVDRIGVLGDAGVWSFYVMGDIWTTVMVATFWAFVNDLNTADEAERLYGIVGLGGVIGGFVGSSIVAGLVSVYGRPPLLYACVAPLVVIGGLAVWIHRRDQQEAASGDASRSEAPEKEAEEDAEVLNPFFEGAAVVLRSRYLLGIAALLGIYEVVSNIVDFQLATMVEEQITASTERDQVFGIIGQATSAVSIGVQLFLTSFVMKRYSVKAALLFLPLAILGGSIGFVAVPTLLLAGFMSVSDNALNYSINQSAREALYTPTSRDAKYKAKAFIDMFIQRAAKVIAVGLNLGLTAVAFLDVRWLSLPVLVLIGLWVLVIRYLGTRFEEQKDPDAEAIAA